MKCCGCNKDKAVHFFSPGEFKKTDRTKRCSACVREYSKARKKKPSGIGSKAWSDSMRWLRSSPTKTLVLLALILMMGCGETPLNKALRETADDLSQVGPLSDNDPDLLRLADYMKKHGMTWDATIGASGSQYCISSWRGKDYSSDPSSYQIECEHKISVGVDAIIKDYEAHRPGYDERQWKVGGKP